jgi:hypothetical protein
LLPGKYAIAPVITTALVRAEGRWVFVKQIELVRRRLLGADGVPGVLSAGWETFELVIAVAAVSADQSADMYPAFTFARGSAVSGRNAIAFAPSMPASYAPSGTPEPVTGDAYQVADAVARLASALSARLRDVAGRAADADDRAACENAAGHADQISKLLAQRG